MCLVAGSPTFGDETLGVVLVDDSRYEGPEDSYGIFHYLWLPTEHLERERKKWVEGINEGQDALFHLLELAVDYPQGDDHIVGIGMAKKFGLRNGQRVPADILEKVCPAGAWDEYPMVESPPRTFKRHAEDARGALLGRVTRISHGFSNFSPALLLTLDVEENLFVSDFSSTPYVVLPVGGYVHDKNVYCGSRKFLDGYVPAEGDRMIVMPFTGPWDHDGEVIAVMHSTEIFIVGEPDDIGVSEVLPLNDRNSVPKTLHEFRDRLWVIRNDPDSPKGLR